MANFALKKFLNSDLLSPVLRKRYSCTPEEDVEIHRRLLFSQTKKLVFVALGLLLLGLVYYVMYYGLDIAPDDLFYSVIAMHLLVFGNLCFGILFLLFSYSKKPVPTFVVRFEVLLYEILLLVIMALFFRGACAAPDGRSLCFSASFLYMVLFSVFCSPFLIDGILIFLVGGVYILVLFGTLVSMNNMMFTQYLVLLILFFGVQLYLYGNNYSGCLSMLRYETLNKQLSRMSTLDGLTGIQNRYSLHLYLHLHRDSWALSHDQVTFFIFDVDHFKLFNDSFSHVAGDACLQKVIETIGAVDGVPTESFFRFGGDEFLVLLVNASPAKVQQVGTAMVKAVEELCLPAAPGAEHDFVTISLGAYSFFVTSQTSFDDKIFEADENLYVVKRAHGDGFVATAESPQKKKPE
jgi:diguanylate cyclase (GGDEF)-like protein